MKEVTRNGKTYIPTLVYSHNVEQAIQVVSADEFELISFPDNVIAIEITNLGSTNAVDFNFEKICAGGRVNISANDGGFLNTNRFKMQWSYGDTTVSIRMHTANDYSYKLIPVIG